MFSASPSERTIRLVKWLLVALPCVPGLVFLLVGWLCDPLWPAQDPTPAMQARYAQAKWQADQLYTAGTTVLAGGLLVAGYVAWAVRRGVPPDEEEGEP